VEYQSVTDDEAQAAVIVLDKLGLHSTPSGVAGYAAWQRDNAAGNTAGPIPLIIVSEQAL
jgi:hypothetical protein